MKELNIRNGLKVFVFCKYHGIIILSDRKDNDIYYILWRSLYDYFFS